MGTKKGQRIKDTRKEVIDETTGARSSKGFHTTNPVLHENAARTLSLFVVLLIVTSRKSASSHSEGYFCIYSIPMCV